MRMEKSYGEALKYITGLLKFGSKPGLERIFALLEALGHPERDFLTVHVAGTNGKGSTSAMAAGALTAAGCKTGLFTSPAVEDFRERIRIDGKYIGKAELVARLADVRAAAQKLTGENPTEFEMITTLAFLHFKREKCSAAVLEAGLGGRFDATNVIPPPAVAVITSISYDHTRELGDTLEKIAFEKCGIIKKGSVVVCYPAQPGEALEVIRRRAREEGAELFIPDLRSLEITSQSADGTGFAYRGKSYFTPLAGRHFVLNALTAIEALSVLRGRGLNVTDQSVRAGISSPPQPARFQTVRKSPRVILDGAHNPDAADRLCENIEAFLRGRRIITVMGMFADKNYSYCIPKIARKSSVFFAVTPQNPRALPASATAELARTACDDVRIIDAPLAAFREACALSGSDDVILACGSFSFLGEISRLASHI